MVPKPAFKGDFVPAVPPTVQIDQINPSTSVVLRTLATFTKTSGPTSESV